MSDDVESRIARLLDRLDGPGVSDREADRIMRQVEFLRQQS